MDSAGREELRMLRARAYGPSADIADDPGALRRLRELESQEHGAAAAQATPAGDAPRPAAAPGPPPPVPPLPPLPAAYRPAAPRLSAPTVTVSGGRAPASVAPPRVPPRRWFLSRGLAVLWVVSLVAVAALAAGIAFAANWVAPIALHSDARQIATLDPVPDFEWPQQLFGGVEMTDVAGYEFRGMTVMRAPRGMIGNGSDAPCIVAVPTSQLRDDQDGFESIFYGCGAGSFPATVQLLIDPSMPDELRNALPVGSAIQFVLDGDRLGVFSDAR